MNKILTFLAIAVFCIPLILTAQQNVIVISKCGGVDTVTIPSITDNDNDGMDDVLEQRLLDHFMPVIIQFDNESCPGPALDGTGDSNLVVCHIYPLPQQYTHSTSLDSVLAHPVALVPKKGLVTGLIWYDPLIKVNTAMLYGEDCGLSGHKADVEGFNYSLKYIGPDTVAGWMYDTIMQHWMGGTIQTISHEGTLCEQKETHPYKSALFPAGLDTVYASPDKHGNYLTISGCGASIICNPGCGGVPSVRAVKAINLGEPNATLIADLGSAYAAYAGNDPWSTSNFLSAQGGNAGAIRTKMILQLTSDFIQGTTLTTHTQICNIYSQCFSTGSGYLDYSCPGTPYNFWGDQLTASGTYYHTLTSSYGCDSTVALTLAVLPPAGSAYNTAVCNGSAYNFNGQQLSAPGVYYDTLSSVYGCDSVVTLTLGINSPVSYSFSSAVCSGSTYLFNGLSLSSSGNYSDTLTNMYGCDSIVFLTLLVDTLPPVTWNLNNDTLLANTHPVLLSGASPSGGVFSGDGVSGNLFYPDVAGAGSHMITYTYTDVNGCSGMATHTFTILVASIDEAREIESSIKVYPNPAHDKLSIVTPANAGLFSLRMYNATGALVKEIQLRESVSPVDILGLPNGIYTLQFLNGDHNAIKKLVIE